MCAKLQTLGGTVIFKLDVVIIDSRLITSLLR